MTDATFSAIMCTVVCENGRKTELRVLTGPSLPQDITEDPNELQIFRFRQPAKITALIEVREGERALFTLRPDGSVECADDFSIDAAAQAFAQAVLIVLAPLRKELERRTPAALASDQIAEKRTPGGVSTSAPVSDGSKVEIVGHPLSSDESGKP